MNAGDSDGTRTSDEARVADEGRTSDEAWVADGPGTARAHMITWPAVAVSVLLLVVFVVIAIQVAVDGRLVTWDLQVTERIVAARTGLWSRVLWAFTLLGNTPVMAMMTAATAGVLFLWGRRSRAVLIVVAVATGTGVSELLKNVLQRLRPPEEFALIQAPASFSLPSGHALVTGVFLGVLVLLILRRGSTMGSVAIWLAAAGVAGAIGFSRIYLGVHWTSDVVGGWCLAGIWLTVLGCAFRAWERSPGSVADTLPRLSARSRAAVVVALALATVVVLVLTALSDPLLA